MIITDGNSSDYPPPEIHPLQRLIVDDGLLLNAQRWRQSHEYHRSRQNLYYQSLYQPGIVRGLGVCVIDAPESISAQYRDNRWVQIQPGIAIDLTGNPIIVDRPIDFRIAKLVQTEPSTIYLVLRYVDPETLYRQSDQVLVAESFRIDEKNTPPSPQEIELCRITISPDCIEIRPATNVFYPDVNELDLRYRGRVRPRSAKTLRVGMVLQGNAEDVYLGQNLDYLLRSLAVLAPVTMDAEPVEEITLTSQDAQHRRDYHLLYMRYSQILSWGETEYNALKYYSDRGTVLFIEASSEQVNIADINSAIGELKQALNDIQFSQISEFKRELSSELTICESELKNRLQSALEPLENIAHQYLGIQLSNIEPISAQDPIKIHPFLFDELPIINREQTRLINWGKIIISIGCLSSGWGLNNHQELSRDSIRSAQELGINILNFAHHHYQLSSSQMQGKISP
ncbi:hypothetical protein H6G70_04095 [Arthrospira platensis FACHB-439]|uniref:hypothetical protein n=1 Tax=Limnospira platensis TaxID=118562 RepID=UPI0016827DF4|nr:hypothetical protein [Arthrospira platensis FACHB-439]